MLLSESNKSLGVGENLAVDRGLSSVVGRAMAEIGVRSLGGSGRIEK